MINKTVATHLWPTPVFEKIIPVKDDWKSYALNLKYNRVDTDNGYISSNKFVLNDLPELKEEITINILNFLHNHISIERNKWFVINESWIVKHNPNDYAHLHSHAGSIFTGVYYLMTPKKCGDLILQKNCMMNNHISSSYGLKYTKINVINCEGHSIKADEGRLVIFPSTVYHNVEKNKSNKDRYCIAFDVIMKNE